MYFRLIDAKRSRHSVSLLCSVLGVSRAGYYAWKDRPASARERRDAALVELIPAPRREQGHLRLARIHAELRHRGVYVSRERVARLMRWAGLSGMVRRRKGRTTIRVPGIATAPDLVRRDLAPTRAESALGRGPDRGLDVGGQALPGGRARLLFAALCRLGDGRAHARRARWRTTRRARPAA
jgi:hypothetical protein